MRPTHTTHNKLKRRFTVFSGDSFVDQRVANPGVGPYQVSNLRRLRTLVPNPRTIIDVGMNLGMNTIEYATFAQNVVGFEPEPDTYALALQNIQMAKQDNGKLPKGWWSTYDPKHRKAPWASMDVVANIQTHNVGLADQDGTLELMQHLDHSGHNSITYNTQRGTLAQPNCPRIQIPVKRLDSFGIMDVDIVKIDVEGFELNVLQGAVGLIALQRPIVQCEMVEKQPKRFGSTCQDIYDFFLSRGYVIQDVDGNDVGTVWKHIPRKMERFFIPN